MTESTLISLAPTSTSSSSSPSSLTLTSLSSSPSSTMSPTLSPNDFPSAPPPTPNPLAQPSPTRARNTSAPLTPSPFPQLSSISIHVSRLAAQLEASDEEEKEPSDAFPFPSFSARMAAAKRRSPIPRLEIKIDPQGEADAAAGKVPEETKEGGVPATPLGAKTPQNSPQAPMTPLYDASMAPMASTSAFHAATPSSAASRMRYTNLHAYQPITPAGSPAAPMTPLGQRDYASSPIPITPTPLMTRESDPPPTPSSATSQRGAAPPPSPQPFPGLPPSQRVLTRSVSQGPPPSSSPSGRAYLQDAVPNTPFELDPATPAPSPNPLYQGQSFSVGLQSIPPSPSPFLSAAGPRRGYKEPPGVPNTPASPSPYQHAPMLPSASQTWPPCSPPLETLHEVDTPQDLTPQPNAAAPLSPLLLLRRRLPAPPHPPADHPGHRVPADPPPQAPPPVAADLRSARRAQGRAVVHVAHVPGHLLPVHDRRRVVRYGE